MLPDSDIKESLSLAYISAVASRAGYEVQPSNNREFGVDGIIRELRKLPNGRIMPIGYLLEFQAKATVRTQLEDSCVVYDMDANAFNKLALREGPTPCILLLFRMPTNPDEWLRLSEEQLLMKNCCYWYSIGSTPTTNTSQKRLRIPRQQAFNPDSLNQLFEHIRQGVL